jgi:arginyl-tRNA--protein-N-Asp/Glu arginylyltransferase
MDKTLRLKQYQKQYQELANSLANIGFIWHGNLQRRMLPCKNKSCDCVTKRKPQHGPYPYWTTKIKQKTVTKLLSAEEADLYEQWIQNRRSLQTTIKKMTDISKKVARLLVSDRRHAF